jgi:predicted ATPase
LREIVLNDLTPLTVLIGPNGSGKSTVLDALNFLSECFRFGLRDTWDQRGRARELITRGQDGPIAITLRYRDTGRSETILYKLRITEHNGSPVVSSEELYVSSPKDRGDRLRLKYGNGHGYVAGTESSNKKRTDIPLRSPDIFAVNVFGQLAEHPQLAALRDLITGWEISDLSVADARIPPQTGPQEHLNRTGSNLANVIQHLRDIHPDILGNILQELCRMVPQFETVAADEMADGRLLLRIKDAPFEEPILARFASDGTLKLLAYFVLLNTPDPPRLIGIEEPENYLHPRLLYQMAEEFRNASAHSQMLVTTHSPHFLDALRPEEVRVLYRDEHGYAQALRTVDLYGVREFMENGGQLGDLWMEGHFNVGDPLSNSGMPRLAARP